MLTVIGDTETYPQCFLLCVELADADLKMTFEISNRRDDSALMYHFLCWMRDNKVTFAGYNVLGFDGPILHMFMRMGGKATANVLYQKAQAIIFSQDQDKFAHRVKPSDRDFPWLCLMAIHHFNNKARATSLKALEFAMRMDDIEDLPFAVNIELNHAQMDRLASYCRHDVKATKRFYHLSKDMIRFREQLSQKYNRDMMNHDDVKIGSTIFEIALEEAGVSLYNYGPEGRTPRQTKRGTIALNDAVLPWIKFEQPEFQRVLTWMRKQIITETKGVFEDVTATINGFTYVFGLGGIHGAVSCVSRSSDDQYVVESRDVSSYYPNLSITNKFYPEHLGIKFCEVYENLYNQRKKHSKSSVENKALKLSLNGTFGKTNDLFSPFYDPLLMLKITINGQMLLCLLIEQLLKIPTLELLMCNTDGLEYRVLRSELPKVENVCNWWQGMTRLQLEKATYKNLFIRDCNNYLGKMDDGEIKRKGAYDYNLGWHQNASALVVPKVVEKVLLSDLPIRETIEQWPDLMDFMIRIKVPRSSYLQWGKERVQNTTRYHIARGGKPLKKWMPPLKGKTEWRKFAVESGWNVQVCNNIKDAGALPVDFDWYIQECEKLILCLQ